MDVGVGVHDARISVKSKEQSPEVLEREIWTAMMTYNLVRLKMLQNPVERGLIGEIVGRLEAKNLTIAAMEIDEALPGKVVAISKCPIQTRANAATITATI